MGCQTAGIQQRPKTQKTGSRKSSCRLFFSVDLRRFELRSAQGNHTFSTCLFQPSVFVPQQDLNHQL